MSLMIRTKIKKASITRGGLILLCLLLNPLFAHAVDVPANMIVVGSITSSDEVTPKQNDQVLVVTASDGKTKGTGTVIDSEGNYAVELSLDASANGTAMSLRLKHAGSTYQLNVEDDPVEFLYAGGLFPSRITLHLTVGEVLSSNAGGGGTGGGGSGSSDDDLDEDENAFEAVYDVDGDGSFTQRDIDLVKSVVAGDISYSSKADINEDGIINTRDIINIIKALHKHRRRF